MSNAGRIGAGTPTDASRHDALLEHRASAKVPLCVDCDGTLIHTDLFLESFLLLIKRNLFAALMVPFWLLLHGKAAAKLRIAALVDIDASTLPYCDAVLDYIRSERERGRKIVLATATAERFAEAVADHLQVFDQFLATRDPSSNLSRANKAQQLTDLFGAGGFEYIGNDSDDLPVWRVAGRISVANAPRGLVSKLRRLGPLAFEAVTPFDPMKAAVKSMRLHQWLKNTLIFVPLIAAHRLTDTPLLLQASLAFLSFGLCASSVYILNDLLDIGADRRHPSKKSRPFACGSLSIPMGLVLKAALLLTAFGLASALPLNFVLALVLYYAVTLSYSIWLKAQVIVDVMLLSGLYTVRIIAGAAATRIPPSSWLLAFSMFLFLSLALVKRYAEMRKASVDLQRTSVGRGYSTDDLVVLLALGAASGYSAVLVLALYINSADITKLYDQPALLWFIIPALAYWISRVWLKTHRGEMDDDPVVFAAKDWQSLLIGLFVAAIGMLASL